MHVHVYQIIKNFRSGPYDSLCHTANRKKFFWSLSKMKMKESVHVAIGEGNRKNLGMFLLRKKSLYLDLCIQIWSNLKKIDYLHLIYHFTVRLNRIIVEGEYF